MQLADMRHKEMINFIPLLVWSMGMLALFTIEEHLRFKGGAEQLSEHDTLTFGKVYFAGCVFWLALGIICLLKS